MKIIVISDTHGNFPLALRACEHAEPIDLAIHLGDSDDGNDAELLEQFLDVDVIKVAGNCDPGSDAPRELIWECKGRRLLLAHGDRYGVKNGMSRLEQRALEAGADAVLFGHTHCATITTRSGMLFVNPGTLMKSGAPTTFAILEISSTGIEVNLQTIS